MGSMSEQMIENANERNEKKLAKYLGIPYEDLTILDYEWHENTGSSGEMVYGFYITFSEDSDKEILEKIKGIDINTRTVDVDLNWNDEPDDFEMEHAPEN